MAAELTAAPLLRDDATDDWSEDPESLARVPDPELAGALADKVSNCAYVSEGLGGIFALMRYIISAISARVIGCSKRVMLRGIACFASSASMNGLYQRASGLGVSVEMPRLRVISVEASAKLMGFAGRYVPSGFPKAILNFFAVQM